MEAIKRLRSAGGWTLLFALKNAGVAQLVEHHLAKVDVASSSLVTRSSLRLERSANRGLERARRRLAKAGRPKRSKTRLAGRPCDVLRFATKIRISPKLALCQINL